MSDSERSEERKSGRKAERRRPRLLVFIFDLLRNLEASEIDNGAKCESAVIVPYRNNRLKTVHHFSLPIMA